MLQLNSPRMMASNREKGDGRWSIHFSFLSPRKFQKEGKGKVKGREDKKQKGQKKKEKKQIQRSLPFRSSLPGLTCQSGSVFTVFASSPNLYLILYLVSEKTILTAGRFPD